MKLALAETNGRHPGLYASDMTKTYGRVQALSHVDFEVACGEIMGLVGQNGAGKSTLMRILSRVEAADEGTVEIHQLPHSGGPGVAVAHQELSLIPSLTVAENVFLGNTAEPTYRSRRRLARMAAPHLSRIGLDEIDPMQQVASLGIGQRYLVELARLLARDAGVLFVDEPTAALSEAEAGRVLRVLRALAESGCAVVLVTHRLDEILAFADRVTVLRDGRHHGPLTVGECSNDRLVDLMFGEALDELFPPGCQDDTGEIMLEFREVASPALTVPLSLSLSRGEILGLAGQVGSGATDLLEALAGLRPLTQGSVLINGISVTLTGRRSAVLQGIGYCSAERKNDGMFPARRVLETLTAPGLVCPVHRVGTRAEKTYAHELARLWSLTEDAVHSVVDQLSGGNQQKATLGKWSSSRLQLLLLAEPTRGVDVRSRAEIYRHLRRLANEGLVVVFATSEVEELLGLADRIVTFCAGKPVRVEPRGSLSPADVVGDVMNG